MTGINQSLLREQFQLCECGSRGYEHDYEWYDDLVPPYYEIRYRCGECDREWKVKFYPMERVESKRGEK